MKSNKGFRSTKAIDTIQFRKGGKYIITHTINNKPLMTLMTLKKVLEKLPDNQFRRIHRSFIISYPKIKSVQGRKLRLLSGKELPVSDSYIDIINEWKKV